MKSPPKVYILAGEPVPLARGRLNSAQRRIYDSQKSLKFLLSVSLRSQHEDRPFFDGPLHLDVTFYMAQPKRSCKQYHHTRPDIDNLIKMLCDISSSILYHDDCLIAKITATKRYDPTPRTEFTLENL
jgi:Holliday junction resolvase RusA-like endonuclease